MATHFQALKGTAARKGVLRQGKEANEKKGPALVGGGLGRDRRTGIEIQARETCMLGLENDISLAENLYSYIHVPMTPYPVLGNLWLSQSVSLLCYLVFFTQ
jgi:hypothetical protein